MRYYKHNFIDNFVNVSGNQELVNDILTDELSYLIPKDRNKFIDIIRKANIKISSDPSEYEIASVLKKNLDKNGKLTLEVAKLILYNNESYVSASATKSGQIPTKIKKSYSDNTVTRGIAIGLSKLFKNADGEKTKTPNIYAPKKEYDKVLDTKIESNKKSLGIADPKRRYKYWLAAGVILIIGSVLLYKYVIMPNLAKKKMAEGGNIDDTTGQPPVVSANNDVNTGNPNVLPSTI
jgi:hypothetical protein